MTDPGDRYPGGWFGESWDAPVCDPARHMPTPVGDRCVECSDLIEEDDQGMIIPFWDGTAPVMLTSTHLTCFLATILPKRGLQ